MKKVMKVMKSDEICSGLAGSPCVFNCIGESLGLLRILTDEGIGGPQTRGRPNGRLKIGFGFDFHV